jgi:hypothetical protein
MVRILRADLVDELLARLVQAVHVLHDVVHSACAEPKPA